MTNSVVADGSEALSLRSAYMKQKESPSTVYCLLRITILPQLSYKTEG